MGMMEGRKEKREGKEDEGDLKKCLLRGLDGYRANVSYRIHNNAKVNMVREIGL